MHACMHADINGLTLTLTHRVAFQEKVQAIHQFMNNHDMGQGLLKRVNNYLTQLWNQYR